MVTQDDAAWTQNDYILAALFNRMGNEKSKPYPTPADWRQKTAHDDRAFKQAERFEMKQRARHRAQQKTSRRPR